jgi:predicted choloylglycine hydrolase
MKQFGNSWIKVVKGIDYLHLEEKNYYDTGYAYGRLLVEANHPIIAFLKRYTSRIMLSTLYTITKKHYKDISIPHKYLDELQGYADATGIAYHHLYCMNFCFDVLKRYGFHCSTISLFLKDRTLVLRNTDLIPFLTRLALKYARSIVVDVAVPGTQRYTHVSLPLFIGVLNGFNHHIALNSHQIMHVKEKTNKQLLATPLLMRLMLEQAESLKEAECIAKTHPTKRSLNIMVTDRQKSIILEVHPKMIKTIAKKGPMCCTTHFIAQNHLHTKPMTASKMRLESM